MGDSYSMDDNLWGATIVGERQFCMGDVFKCATDLGRRILQKHRQELQKIRHLISYTHKEVCI